MGKQQKHDGESALNSNLAGKHIFLAGLPFTLAGQRFSGVVTGGCTEAPGRGQEGAVAPAMFSRTAFLIFLIPG